MCLKIFLFHDLATTLVSGTDTVDLPLANGQTDVSGNLATLGYKSSEVPTDIIIRARSSSTAPKYIDKTQTGTITAAGFTLDVTLEDDPVAT